MLSVFSTLPCEAARKVPYQKEKSAYFRKPSGYWRSSEDSFLEKTAKGMGTGFKNLFLGLKNLINAAGS
jgi:hypothetical protein